MNQKKHIIKHQGKTYHTQTGYASYFVGKTRKDVNQLVRVGSIESYKHPKRGYVVAGHPPAGWVLKDPASYPWEDEIEAAESEPTDATSPEEAPVKPKPVSRRPDLNLEKARKMAAEAELAELKLAEKRREQSARDCETILSCLQAGFNTEVIPHLHELNLKKPQTDALKRLYANAFKVAVTRYNDIRARELSLMIEAEADE